MRYLLIYNKNFLLQLQWQAPIFIVFTKLGGIINRLWWLCYYTGRAKYTQLSISALPLDNPKMCIIFLMV